MRIPSYAAIALTLLTACSLQAAVVFTDDFSYSVDDALLAEGGWTSLPMGGTLGVNFGVNAASGLLWGNPTGFGNTVAGLEYNYTTALREGDTLTMDANVDITGGRLGYGYTMSVILWDGINAGTRTLVAGGVCEYSTVTGLTQVSHVVTAGQANRTAIFQHAHTSDWGHTHACLTKPVFKFC